MTTNTHIQRRGRRGRRAPFLLLLSLIVLPTGAAVTATESRGLATTSPAHGYNWPLKPFDRPHPVRANFGDPRTYFGGPLTMRRLMHGSGNFHVHAGVDIAAADGTAVYPVRSGVVKVQSHETVMVFSDGGNFDYWHIVPAVRDGQSVTAYRTVLGHVRRGFGHVHMTEYTGGGPINPLARGHLRPYGDRTRPQVRSVEFRTRSGAPVLPEFVRGSVSVVADAFDMPSKRVSGKWHDLPVAPARLSWHVRNVRSGRVVVPSRTEFDVGQRLPQRPFWATYARGTRQNMTGMGPRGRAWYQPGVYLYQLGTLDSTSLRDGVYELVVTASDTRGNSGSLRQVFSVRNAARWMR
jgi:hypothetical protein